MKKKEIAVEVLDALTNINRTLLKILDAVQPKTSEEADIEKYKAQYEVPSSANFLSEDFGIEHQVEFDHK